MRWLFLIFVVCSVVLIVLMRNQSDPAYPFPDGRLLAHPVPPARKTEFPALLQPQPLLPAPAPAGEQSEGASRLEILDALSPHVGRSRVLARAYSGDPADWGIAHLQQPEPAPVVTLVEPQPLQPESRPPAQPFSGLQPVLSEAEAFSGPNLYLPEGAVNEAGAQLTLIREELSAHELPNSDAPAAPFALKEGDQVRPLTRLRGEKDFDWIKFRRDGKEWWARAEYFIRVDPRNRTVSGTGNLPIGEEAVDRTSALPPDYCPDDLVAISREFTLDDREIRLRREAAEAFERMSRAAARDKVTLRVFSGYRDFAYQKKLYLEAVETKGPKQNGVAAPGYSEHQLGTTIDVSGLDRRFILRGSFAETPEGQWLAANGEKFGFRHSYTQENMDESGYKPEPWHLRYVGLSRVEPQLAKARAN